MRSTTRHLVRDRWAEVGLGATLLVAPLAGGGWRLEVLPVIALFATAAFAGALVGASRGGREVPVPPLALGLLAMALFTVAQAVPLPEAVVSWLSPRVAEVRAFVVGDPRGPISYEPSATWREVGKLLVYAAVVLVVAVRARERPRTVVAMVCRPLVVAGLAVVLVALVHRGLGVERLFGLIDTSRAPDGMWTTFVNPNHAAGFLNLTAFAAVALAIESQDRARRFGFGIAAGLLVAVSLAMASKGGALALVASAVTLLLALRLRSSMRGAWMWAVVGGLIAVSVAAASAGRDARPGWVSWGVTEKLDAVRDALPLIDDHAWLGVGRGAFVSVYPAYKTSALQLTFAFPENLAAQLLSEWGLVMGSVAFTGLLVLLVSMWLRTTSPSSLAALAGVTAVVVQNFVDFSLELAGVAIAVVAVLTAVGGTGVRRPWGIRGRPVVFAAGGLIVAGAFGAFVLSWTAGDLDRDLARLRGWMRNDPRPADVEVQPLWRRHPASPIVSAYVSFLRETAKPPDLAGALRAANRTLFLAPRYVDGHLSVGRLLIRAGRRQQGFEALRQAWMLSVARRTEIRGYIIRQAQSPEEVLRAVPRRDDALDVVDEALLASAVAEVGRYVDRGDWVAPLFAALPTPAEAPPRAWPAVVRAALTTQQAELGLRWVTHWRQTAPSPAAGRLHVRLLMLQKRFAEASALLSTLPPSGQDGLQLGFQIALKAGDWTKALDIVDTLQRQLTPSRANLIELAKMRAQVHARAGALSEAVTALSEAVSRAPSDAALRLARARLLLKVRRRQEAAADVRFILRRWPKHKAALALMARINAP